MVLFSGLAGADVTESESLQGLDEIMIVVEALHEDAGHIGLTREALLEEVTVKLDRADIEILTIQERMADERRPYLYVNCNIVYVESISLTSFSIDVEVHQRVTLANGEKAQALTWAKSYLGIQGQTTAAVKIREVIGLFVDQFVRGATQSEDSVSDGASATPE